MMDINEPERIPSFIKEKSRSLIHGDIKNIDPESIFKLCYAVIDTIQEQVTENQNDIDEELSFGATVEAVENSQNLTQLMDRFLGEVMKVLDYYFSSRQFQKARPVRTAIQFMEENYQQQITLESIADILHLSPNYFSRIFKTEMGIGFNEYLNNIRMDKAKKLLKESQYSIGEIAEMTGYSNPKYFSKVFSKMFGIRPIKYRKL
jgi:two-component system response regulator YesN